jgi:hypothetical protein
MEEYTTAIQLSDWLYCFIWHGMDNNSNLLFTLLFRYYIVRAIETVENGGQKEG